MSVSSRNESLRHSSVLLGKDNWDNGIGALFHTRSECVLLSFSSAYNVYHTSHRHGDLKQQKAAVLLIAEIIN